LSEKVNKIVAACVVLLLLFGLWGWSYDEAAAAGGEPVSPFEFNAVTGAITGYSNDGPKDVVIPDSIGGVPVTSIAMNSFTFKGITSLIIPDTITSIGGSAFLVNNLTELTIPDSVISIGGSAFFGNNIRSLTLSKNLRSIGDKAFERNQLTEVVLPDGLETIDVAAFYQNQLTSVTIPDSYTSIKGGVFSDNQFIHVTIPFHVASLANHSFTNNPLTTVDILSAATEISDGAFSNAEMNPSNVTIVGHYGSSAETYANKHSHNFLPLVSLSQTGLYTFTAATAGYAPVTTITVSVTKNVYGDISNLAVALSGSHTDNFELSALGATSLNHVVKETAFTIAPKSGLSNGTYTATATVTGDYGFSASFNVQFTVQSTVVEDNDPPPSTTEPSTSESTTPGPTSSGVNVLVNGKVENAGTATTEEVNGQQVMTIVVDEEKLRQRLEAEGENAVITIPAAIGNDVVIGELNGRMIKNMEFWQATVEMRTEQAVYTLPAGLINMDEISKRFGANVGLEDIKIRIEIAKPLNATLQVVDDAASANGLTIMIPPLNFSVKAVYGDHTEEVASFNTYVERLVAIPEGVDPNRITTGVIVERNGTVRHVPTKVVNINGKYYAQINSLTNSTYTTVWHPLAFKDMTGHWAEDAVNDMGSRMVVTGTDSGMFSPDQDMTRAEFVAILVRGLGLRLETGDAAFTDVKASDWYSSIIQTAYKHQLINGFDGGSFRPNEKITREQAMLIVTKAMAITKLQGMSAEQTAGDILHAYTDAAAVSDWAMNSIADNVQAGIVAGRGNHQLAPKAYMTRAEAAIIVQRLLQKSKLI
jgi:hypothetical protein